MSRRQFDFNLGDMTDRVWSGDIVTKCEYLGPLDGGRMLFRDHTFHCYRVAFWERLNGEFVLNGWTCGATVEELR